MELFEYGAFAGGFILWAVNEIRKYREGRISSAKKLAISIRTDEKIYPQLWKMWGKYAANRVFITQLHNGSYYHSGQSIQQSSITHEVCGDGVQGIKKFNTNLLISETMYKILAHLRQNSYLIVNDSSPRSSDYDLIMDLRVYGVSSMVVLPIHNKSGDIIATLTLTFKRANSLGEIEIMAINNIKLYIENCLNVR